MRAIRAGPWIAVLVLSCRAPTPALAPAWLRDVDVGELGSGQCVLSDAGELVCEKEWLLPKPPLSEPVRSLAGVPNGPACALLESGQVACWGCAQDRVVAPFELGARDEPRRAGTTLLPLRAVEQVVLSNTGACALQHSGAVDCWGPGFWSTVYGDETSAGICGAEREDLKRLRGLPPFDSVAMTLDGRLCGVTRSGSVACAGQQHSTDALGNGETEPEPAHPMVPPARSISAGEQHFCALGLDGSVTCWGENLYGQCATTSEPCVENQYGKCRVAPTRASLPEKALSVTAGARHSCALLESGRVACWGANSHDALGFPATTACHPYYQGFCTFTPTVVPGLTDVHQVVASRLGVRTWAHLQSGHVVAWPGPIAAPDRPLGEPCRDLNGVLSLADVLARHPDIRGQRIRVRGRLSTTQIFQQKVTLMGSLALHPGPILTLRPGEELVVDGKVVNLIVVGADRERQTLPGLNVFDLCRVPMTG